MAFGTTLFIGSLDENEVGDLLGNSEGIIVGKCGCKTVGICIGIFVVIELV